MSTAHSLDALIQALRRLPGVGVKSASRMAFHLLQHDRDGALHLAICLARPAPAAQAERVRSARHSSSRSHCSG